MKNKYHYLRQLGSQRFPSWSSVLRWATLCVLALFFVSCNVTKRLGENEYLYRGAEIKINKDSLEEYSKSQRQDFLAELEPMLRPVPNKKILGMYMKLWFYQVAGNPKSENGLRGWMKNKMGEEPVLMSSVFPERNASLLQNKLENMGYFVAEVAGDTTIKGKWGNATYTISTGKQYNIRNVSFPGDTSVFTKMLKEIEPGTLLKSGDPYSFSTIRAERERIDAYSKEHGYYLFSPDYLLMRVDSSIGDYEVDIYVTLKRETPSTALRPWYIRRIIIYPNYEPSLDSLMDSSFKVKNYYVIDPKNDYKSKVFERTIFFEPGEMYNRADHNKTLNRLVNVGTFKFVKNSFTELPIRGDSAWLNAYYYLVSAKKNSTRLETTGKTSSANFAGVELNLNWRNRNMFKGAELLMLKLTGGLDVQFGGVNSGYNIYHFGAEASITWPRFIPFNLSPNTAFVPHSKFTIGDEWQMRQRLYTVNTLRSSFGWAWKKNVRTEYEFNPFNITYVRSKNVSQEYRDSIAKDSTLARIIEQQLIIGPSFGYTYTNTIDQKKLNGFYYNGKMDLSSNLLGALQGANVKENNAKSLFGVQYSQFLRTEHDFRYYRRLGTYKQNIVWANRIDVGLGVPYGNSLQLPFIKQFFVGGSNSLRAFRVRSVGPGTFNPEAPPGSFIPDLVGDIKLELNTELRAKLFSIVHGALFVDAGNIWLFNDNPLKPGGKFSSSFLNELAVGAGVGLRFDIASIFMLRFDVGVPIRKVMRNDVQQWEFRWVIRDIEPKESDWRKENIILNIGIGLPF